MNLDLEEAETAPLLKATLQTGDTIRELPVLVDTGSQFGLLVKSSSGIDERSVIGWAIGGPVRGCKKQGAMVRVDGRVVFNNEEIFQIDHQEKESMSIGMGILKNYRFTINLVKGYFRIERMEDIRPLQPADHNFSKPHLASVIL